MTGPVRGPFVPGSIHVSAGSFSGADGAPRHGWMIWTNRSSATTAVICRSKSSEYRASRSASSGASVPTGSGGATGATGGAAGTAGGASGTADAAAGAPGNGGAVARTFGSTRKLFRARTLVPQPRSRTCTAIA